MKTFFTQLSADAKLILNGIVNLAGNSVIIAALPALLPHTAVVVIFLVFNLAQVIYSFANPSYAVHLIETGQMKAPVSPFTGGAGITPVCAPNPNQTASAPRPPYIPPTIG